MDLVQIKSFLARAVPWPSATMPGYIGIHSPFLPPGAVDPVFPGRAFTGFDNAVNYVQGKARQMKDDLYVCMSLQSTAKPSRSGKRMMLDRARERSMWLKSFYLELDLFDPVKRPNNYKTSVEAAHAFRAWRIQLGMPDPSLVIWSGSGGYHFHWVTPEPIHISIWQPLADALKNACEAGGLLADPVVTAEPSRLLRIPGTHNFKHNPPANVGLMADRPEVPLSVIESVLGKYKGAPTVYAQRVTGALGAPSSAFAGVALPGRLDDGIETWKPTIEDVADECPFIGMILSNGGENRTEPEWFESLKVAYYVKDGPQVAHELSDGYAYYNPDQTDDYYWNKIDATHSGGRLGPPTCVTIEGRGALECLRCKHRGGPAKQSPVNLVKLVTTVASAVTVVAAPVSVTTPVSTGGITITTQWPDPFKHDPKTRYVYKETTTDDDPPRLKIEYVVKVPILSMWVQEPNEEHGYFAVNFECLPSKSNTPTLIHIPYSDSVDPRKLAHSLAEKGLPLENHQVRLMKELMTSFVQQLRNSANQAYKCESYGWSVDNDAFSFDRVRFNCKGNNPVVPAYKELDDTYRSQGDYNEWAKRANLIIQQQRPVMNFGLCIGAGTPFIKFTGDRGVVVSFMGESGVGKTAMAKIVQTMWGKARQLGTVVDTVVAVNTKLGVLSNLPLILDDIKLDNKDAMAVVAQAINITQGRSKARGKRDGSLAPTMSWDTTLLTTSNYSMQAFMSDAGGETTASMNRLLETRMLPNTARTGMINSTEAKSLFAELDHHFGLAGRKLAQAYGSDPTGMKELTLKCVDAVNNEVQGTDEDRYWVTAGGIAVAGAIAIRRYLPGLEPMDLDALTGFIRETIQDQRRMRSGAHGNLKDPVNVERLIIDFLNSTRDRMLVTDQVFVGMGKPNATFKVTAYHSDAIRGAISARYARNQRLVRISLMQFGHWAKRERNIMRKSLEFAIGNTLPVKFGKFDLSSGVEHYKSFREDGIEIDLTAFPNLNIGG